MVRRPESEPVDRDEQLGEAIEAYLAEAEAGSPPDPEHFAARYPDLSDDLRAALEGLALVRGLVGEAEGPGRRLESGRRIAGYRIVRELGRGGMGTVYEAVHVGLDRPVALKVLGTHAAPDSTGRRRFLNEARTAAGLHHTHIVPVFDVGQVGGLCYYAMQRIEGSGLDRVLRHLRRDRQLAAGSSTGGTTPAARKTSALSSGGPLTGLEEDTVTWVGGRSHGLGDPCDGPSGLGGRDGDRDSEPPPYDPPRGSAYYRWVAEVGREAAEALSHAHRRGIIHRDVKPSNLLVDARGIVWVADFGLARRLADPGLTHHDSLLGTPRYMSPEQARIGPIDGRTDVYSLGATLYELLTLRPPFEGRTAAELVEQIRDTEAPPPRQTDPRIPRDLETIVLKALAKRPADRYASAQELAEDLERFLHHAPVQARRIGLLGRAWRYARRHPGITGVSTVAAATVLAVATVAYVNVMQERDATRIALQKEKRANQRTNDALLQAEAARRKERAASRERLLSHAKDVRHTTLPNRRARGLDALKEAAGLGPDRALRTKLRDEAIELLALRDVEARREIASGPARGIVFSPDGSRLAALSESGEDFSLWDVGERRLLVLEQHRLGTRSRSAATPPTGPGGNPPAGGWSSSGRGGLFRRSASSITAVGDYAVATLPDGTGLRVFDLATAAPVRDWNLAAGRRLHAVAAAAGGDRLVTVESAPVENAVRDREGPPRGDRPRNEGPREYTVCLYGYGAFDQPIKTLCRITTISMRDVPLVAISPEGDTVATALVRGTAVAGNREATISLWSAEKGEALGDPIDGQPELTAMALGPDGLLAAAGGGLIRFWELESRTPLPSATPHQSSFVRYLRFNPKGTLLAAGGGRGAGIELWDLAAHSLVAVLPAPASIDPEKPNDVEDVAFSPDGRTLVAANSAAPTSVWAIVDPLLRAQIGGFDSPPTTLVFGSDERLIMGTTARGGTARGTIRAWSPGQCPSTAHATNAEPPPGATPGSNVSDHAALTFDDRDRLIGVDPFALAVLDDPAHPRNRSTAGPSGLFGPPLLAQAVASQVLFVTAGSQILAWDPADHPEGWHALAVPGQRGPRGPRSDREREHERERDRDRFVRDPLRGGPLRWQQIAASPDGNRLYVADNLQKLRVMDREGWRLKPASWSFDGPVSALALSPDGLLLALGDRQGNVTLVDTEEGIVQARMERPTAETETDGAQVSTLAFSPAGSELAVRRQQGAVELWSPNDPTTPLVRLAGRRGSNGSLAFDREGHYLASTGTAERVVDVWDLDRIKSELEPLGLAW